MGTMLALSGPHVAVPTWGQSFAAALDYVGPSLILHRISMGPCLPNETHLAPTVAPLSCVGWAVSHPARSIQQNRQVVERSLEISSSVRALHLNKLTEGNTNYVQMPPVGVSGTWIGRQMREILSAMPVHLRQL